MPSKLPKGQRPAQQKSLAQELAEHGVVVDDWPALWAAARQLGTPPRWKRPVVAALELRYAPDGTPIRTHQAIAAEWRVWRQRVQTILARSLTLLARQECVARYGHYVSAPTYQPTLAERHE